MKINYVSVATFIMLSAIFNSSVSNAMSNAQCLSSSDVAAYTSPWNCSREEVNAFVKQTISEIKHIDKEKITDESNLIYDLGLDSLDIFELVQSCQDYFGIDYNIYDVMVQANAMTVKTFVDINWYFCEHDGDFEA